MQAIFIVIANISIIVAVSRVPCEFVCVCAWRRRACMSEDKKAADLTVPYYKFVSISII